MKIYRYEVVYDCDSWSQAGPNPVTNRNDRVYASIENKRTVIESDIPLSTLKEFEEKLLGIKDMFGFRPINADENIRVRGYRELDIIDFNMF